MILSPKTLLRDSQASPRWYRPWNIATKHISLKCEKLSRANSDSFLIYIFCEHTVSVEQKHYFHQYQINYMYPDFWLNDWNILSNTFPITKTSVKGGVKLVVSLTLNPLLSLPEGKLFGETSGALSNLVLAPASSKQIQLLHHSQFSISSSSFPKTSHFALLKRVC